MNCITYIFGLILFAGLAAMLFTTDKLFTLHLSEKLYFDIWLIVVGIFGPAFFLADIPRSGTEFTTESFPPVLKVLLTWLVMPMLGAYTTILYAYFTKIILTRQWPEGIVAHLVLWYAIISTIVIFFIYNLRQRSQWVTSFLRFFPWLCLPLLGMMFVSMQIRIKAYGITESRYLVMLAGLWALGSMLYFIFHKKQRNIVIVIAVSLLAVMAVSGPWSAYSVSKNSQNARFAKILQRNGMLSDGVLLKANRDLPLQDQQDLQSIIYYFARTHSLKEMRNLPADFELKQTKDYFGFDVYEVERLKGEYFHHNLQQNGEFLPINGYDYLLDFTYYHSKELLPSGPLRITYQQETQELRIVEQGRVIYTQNIADLALRIHQQNVWVSNLPYDAVTVTEQNEAVKVTYLFKRIQGRQNTESGEGSIDYAEFYLLVKSLK